MARENRIGEFEELVLLAILDFGGEAYGLEILNALEQKASRKTSIGALYETLKRMTIKGLISARDLEGPPARNGRPRRYFKVEVAGELALREADRARSSFGRSSVRRVAGEL
jgi:PadR family transcriptional regulator, regulatory protein PadR